MILLDTHVIVWAAVQPDKLSDKAKHHITQSKLLGEIYIADISLWEIAMLFHKKRIIIDTTYSDFIQLIKEAFHLQILPITPAIAELSVSLGKEINSDPADRIICATSIIHGAALLTADENLRAANIIQTVW